MTYPNLRKLMDEKNVTGSDMMRILCVSRTSWRMMLNREIPFSIDDAMDIKGKFFPEYTIEFLFKPY